MRPIGAHVHNNPQQSVSEGLFVGAGLGARDDASDIGILALAGFRPVLFLESALRATLLFFLRLIAPCLLAIALIDRRSAVRAHD
jgi:hypothetical protein